MAYTFKDFRSDCYGAGQNMAASITPPITYPITLPLIGALMSVTVAPVLIGGSIAYEKSLDKIQLLKRQKVSAAETNISKTFGKISVKGYRFWGGGIETKFEESCVYTILNNKISAEPDIHRMKIHHNREQGIKDMLGNLAQEATTYGRSMSENEERFIVVKKKGDLSSHFYKVNKIDSASDAPKNSIVAAQHYYEHAIGHGSINSERIYAISDVDAPTAKRLKKMGL